ncbi:chromosome segregation protein SMC [Sporosarcina ureilytica]|uniref:Chromosome partition protein Smc n=1 Tax=Sporosarcina ureilytica TaxID=298596 RepID=A0A1D8JHY9_9BACL|nr:chromosome segregation protein SMC [Sporosarcina ureilytica]AOV08294.1 chromosome segregation protein SMC [Sporosarcina ureilytica]
MFLKRLEIIGFKSFAERIGVDFVPGVTAVVGPNGSGKSNITDAIRWVLGEQSARSLRGAKMEDVIFAGSDSRKPLNFAEVTLILDNSKGLFPLDYTEISVTRRVFRSGESIYLLNGQQCRLKDITDVFMDSGLGKEAFSIISQGRVDEILNSRPEDRRSIFDEAAGVLKYRTRKRKAEHKLFETSDNLDRVLDILKELDIRIEPLKEQAEAAKKHEEISEEVREADILLLNYDAGNLHEKLQEKLVEVEKQRAEKELLTEAIDKTEVESSTINKQLEQQEEKFETLQQKLVQVSAESEKWEGRRLLSVEKERNASLQIERVQTEFQSAKAEQEDLEEKLKESYDNVAILNKEYEEVKAEVKDTTQMLTRSVKETEHEIEELKSSYIDGLNEEATIRNELKHIEERLLGEKTSSQKINEQTVSLRNRLEVLNADRKLIVQTLDRIKQSATEASENYKNDAVELKKHEDDLRSKQELLQKAHNKQHEMQGRLRALQSLEADFSGFYSGVKEVLVAREAGKLAGIEGAVAELITVENDYIKAVETALGGAMQHIVTSSEVNARKAIGYLKTQNKGRATFLPLDVMRSRKIQQSTLQTIARHPEFIGIADGLIRVEPNYKIIAENLLGNVLVASSLAGASAIAKALNYRYRVVTLDGDIVNAGGSLTGGGTQGRSSVFSRRAELEMLTTQVEQMSASIERGNESISDTKLKVAEYMQKVEHFRKQSEALQLEMATAEANVRESDMAIHTVQSELETVEIGRLGAETAGSELMEKKKELETAHAALKKTLESLQAEITKLERLAADWRNEEATLTARLTELRERAAILREQLSYQNRAITDMEASNKVAIDKINLLQQELDYLTDEEQEHVTAEEIAEQIERSAKDKQQIENSIAEIRKNRSEIVIQKNHQETHLRQLRENAEKLNAKLHEHTIELSRLEVTYETITQRLFHEYGLRPDDELALDFNEQEKREQLARLKHELKNIGPINPSAVQEYEEVSERHQFLTAQRNDLLEAKETLQEAMSEMDHEMSIRFSSTFDAVQNQFRQVFKEMFGGGNADLILTDPTDLLHTGIDIVARPPGKKMQNLSLLSGGERALTAISLLFSIIEVRPVPFCILDEVEAALDEANVIRYSNYLRKFSDKTQFIVITHRKGTMEGADVLYGITMQESGVSKLISVKLSEVPEEAMM